MPWRPLPRIAFAVAIFPFQPSSPADLPLELGDELYIIEQGGAHGSWYRGYLVAPPSLLAGLTSVKGQTLEARVFSGIFPRNCVEIREYLGDTESRKALENGDGTRVNGIKGIQDEALERVSNQGQDVSGIFETDGKQHRRSESATTYRSNSVPLTPSSITARPTGAKPAAPVPMLKIGDETPTSYEEPLVDEIASCLREWHSTNLHELLLTRQYGVVDTMYNVVLDLDLARRQLLHDVLTSKEKAAVRQMTVWNLVRGNKMLTGETIVRDPQQSGRLLTGDDSAIELTKLQSEMSMFDEDPRQQGDLTSLRHLLLEIKTIAGSHAGPVTLSFYLSTKLDNGMLKPLSETYVLEIQSADSFMALAHTSRLKTLFTELCASDVGDGSGAETHLYLVVMVQSAELPRPSLSYATRTSASRDGGVARSPSNMHSVKGSVKARRSMVWANKTPRPGQPEIIKENPPRSADSTNSQAQVENNSLKDATVIRTVGAGILDVAHIVRQTFEAEHVINIWSPLDEDSEEVGNDNEGFDELIRSVLPSSSGRYSRCYQASQLQLHFYPFIDSDADTLVRNNPTLMHNVTQTPRMGFAAAPSQPRSDIYLTISRARFPWPALLCHPQAGQVPVPVNTSFRNLQLTLEVRNASGARLDRCIFASSNSTGHTAWRTTVTDRSASWDQTIRLNIPTEQVPGAHVIMSIADAPEFPFALCWLPLWNNQAFIHDGCHSLLLHAYDKVTSSVDEEGRGAYLGLPWSSLHKNSSVPDESVTGPLSTVLVETNLCSTEYSQDHIILGLVSWKKKSGNEVLELLRRVLFVPQIEIVKQLRDVFDALFGILVDNAGSEEYEDLIFNALVTVLGIIHDRRYNIGPLVDNYIENQFNFPFATPCLIRSFLRLLQSHDTPQQSRNLRAALKIGRYILKFIISARKQQKLKEEGIGVTKVQPTFNRDLHAIFKCLEALMKNPSPVLVGTKTLVVQHFHTWLPELKDVLPKDELIMISLSFMDSCKEVKGMLILYKLILIQSYTKLDIFASEDDRDTLISCCSSWLDPYWGKTGDVTDQYRDQVRLCASIVAQFSQYPNPQLYSFMRKITSSYCAIALEGVEETSYLSMLYSKAFPFQVKASDRKQKFDEALIELAGLIAAISNIPNPKLPVLKLDDTASFVLESLETHKSIIGCEAYPENWLSLHIYNHRAAVKNLENLASMLTRSFLPPPEEADNFDMKLWELFFATLLKIVSSDALTLETFPEQKRRAVWKIGGDVREQGAALLRNAWEAIGWEIGEDEKAKYGLNKLGGYQVQYVPSLIPGIIELCLSVHEGLRRVAVQILQTMIISEWDLNQDLSIIEMEIVTSLDTLFQNKHMNESITQKLFISELLDLFEPIEKSDEALAADVKGLIATIDELLELLVACSSGGITESLHTLRLMEFMKDMDREDIFIRYVHELAQTQATEQNYTQAGLALQFHADLYTWDFSRLVPALTNPAYPEQSAFERKEALYFKIIQYFEDGKAWTHALACYKELSEQYEHIIMDFAKLSRAQGSMAKIYDTIAKEEKAFPRYFRVSYRGLGFPTTLRDKEFIFEAFPNERMASFTDRIQKLHPAAHIASPSETEDIEGQFLQISAVSPHREILHPVYQRSKVPHSVREHLLISMPLQFSYTSKRHTSAVDVKDQWVEKTVLTTAEPFPNILRRSEIVSTEILELTPLQTAIERTWRKTQELHLLAQHVISGDDSTLTGLTEALVQLLDLEAPHSSCVAVYRVFLANPKEDEDHESTEHEEEEDGEIEQKPIDPLENALAVALIDHALSIKRCLSLYSRPSHQATQAEFLARFEDVFGPEIASLAAHAQTTTPPQSANQSSDRSTPLANGHRSELAARSFSPEQELIRTSRSDSQRKHFAKPSLSHRISIANPFKRSNHNASSSVATVHQSPDLRQSSDINTGQQSSNGRDREENDDDAVTVHSHATSRGGKSEKRRSWFGGDAKAKHKATNSIAGHGSEEQVDQQGRNRSRARSTATNKSAKSHDASSHSRSRHNRLESKKSTPVLAGGGWDSAPTALPRTSQSDPRRDSSDRFAYSDKQPSSTVTITAGRSNGHGSSQSPSANAVPSASTGSVRESVKKRFSLLKGMNKKSSRLNVREDGGDTLAESLREE